MQGGRGIIRRLLAAALLTFPRDFRDRYREDALAYFEDRLREARGRSGRVGVAWLVVRTLVDVVVSGSRERIARLRTALTGSGADVRYAFRSLRRRPGFVVAAALPVALGMAGVTTVFAVIDGVLLRPLPYPEPDRLVEVGRPLESGALGGLSPANAFDLQGELSTLERVGIFAGGGTLIDPEGEARVASITRVDPEALEVLGLTPAVGRTLGPDDTAESGAVLVTWSFARDYWGDPSAAVGGTLAADHRGGRTFRVVGVISPDFTPPEALGGMAMGDIWWPLDPADPLLEQTRAFDGFGSVVARIAPGRSLQAVNRELEGAAERLAEAHPDANRADDGAPEPLEARPLHAQTVGDFGPRLALLMGAVAALLAIACANVANLFLARGVERERELALRGVMGAGTGRLAVQLLAEAVAVALVGGVVGVGLATLGLDALLAWTPELPRAGEVALDLRVAGAALLATLASGVVFGLAPLGIAARREPATVLGGGRARRLGAERLRGLLVVGQTALAVVLVTGAGLLVNSAARLATTELGFDPDGVLVLSPRTNGVDQDDLGPLTRDFVRTASAVPGVERVSGALLTPGAGPPISVQVTPDGAGAADDPHPMWWHSVLPGFFETLGVPVLAGRGFDEDPERDRGAAVVNEAFARGLWGEERAIGRSFRVENGPGGEMMRRTVVGVVGSIRYRGARHAPEPVFYESYLANPWLSGVELLVRHRPVMDPNALREAFRGDHPGHPVTRVSRLDEVVAESSAEERAWALLLAAFSLIALGIASVGIYATMAYSVTRRFGEVALRRAVGADAGDIVRLVVGRALVLAASGVGIGVVVAALSGRVLSDLLFEITPRDPATLAVVAGLLLVVALVACVVPARRATRVDPARVLGRE